MRFKTILLGSVLALQACVSLSYADICENKQNIDGVQWVYSSDEKKAVYLEVYNLAAERITERVKTENLQSGQWGIILDIDETALDNSWYEYENYKTYEFSISGFNDMTKEKRSKALPGVSMLVNLVHNLGGYVSFVTNRDGLDKDVFDATVDNMKSESIYYDQIIFSNNNEANPHNKNPRFNAVETGIYSDNILTTTKLPAHEVIAYFGDNIQDFPNMTQANMRNQDDSAYKDFGKKYFIIPNPRYGSWQ